MEPQETLKEIPTEIPTEQQEALASSSMFQAVGVIAGTVRFDENSKALVTVGNKEYPLYYVPNKNKRKAYEALIKEIAATGNHYQRLIVYPRVLHFPKREQIHQVSFQLIGFETERTTGGVGKDLQDFEFRLCGLWQFIPVCQTPCITVLRNFTSERLDYVKNEETSALSKVNFMKASHVPVIWRDAPVKPFRFNPKVPKEQQGHASFVEIKVRFLPGRDVFGFEQLLASPSEKPPRFFKARKEDKAEALKIKREMDKHKRERGTLNREQRN
ncbi:MAG: hypothetical protein KME33_27915 [Aetokthonos hydrillicola CCALA 1050]|nr:hypothetical protein [Aetokthonos hydrillicola CCALA 1050]